MTNEQQQLNEFLSRTEPIEEVEKLKAEIEKLNKELESTPSFDDFPTFRELVDSMSAPITKEYYQPEKSLVAVCPDCGSQVMASICPHPPPPDHGDLEIWKEKHVDTLLEIGSCALSGLEIEIIDRKDVDMKGCGCDATGEVSDED